MNFLAKKPKGGPLRLKIFNEVPPLNFDQKKSGRFPAKRFIFLDSTLNSEAKTPNKITVIARR